MKSIAINLKLAENVKQFVNVVNKYDYDMDLRSGRHGFGRSHQHRAVFGFLLFVCRRQNLRLGYGGLQVDSGKRRFDKRGDRTWVLLRHSSARRRRAGKIRKIIL